jgi:hypothetical protein
MSPLFNRARKPATRLSKKPTTVAVVIGVTAATGGIIGTIARGGTIIAITGGATTDPTGVITATGDNP